MNNYIFVAYYTTKTPYEKEVRKLKASLDSLNLPYDIQGYPSKGSWQANIAFKPEFVLEMICKHPTKDIIYIDADAIVRSRPIYFDTFSGDIGVHYKDGQELLSGTIYLRNNSKVKRLVQSWISEQQHNPHTWDQKTLQRVIVKSAKELQITVVNIPANYTQIFDSMAHNGVAIIEHFQASRRYKADLSDRACYPDIVYGSRVRVMPDGTFTIPRRNKQAEEYLNTTYIRVPNELRWYPVDPGGKRIDKLRSKFAGKHCYIVGKGPSLDFLNEKYFEPNCPIITINEAIHKVESLNIPNQIFMMQQDLWLKETCRPKRATVVLFYRIRGLYKDIEDRYIFMAPEVGAPIACLTASYAICMVRKFKCSKITMVSFDACVNQKTTYARCIGTEPTSAGDPMRFLKHKKAFELYLQDTPVEWAIPTVPA